MIEGLTSERVTVGDTTLHVRVGGSGPPLLLLHGYPQTSAMWHRVAPSLTGDYTVIAPDLPGYGASDAPEEGPQRYTKHRMAQDMTGLMAHFGHARFMVAAHDRGARVAYRLALESPQTVTALALLDIVPTGALWADFSVARAMAFYHWLFLAQPAPLPEQLIGHDPAGYLDITIARWTKAKDLSPFSDAALAEYRDAFSKPQNVRAACDDYRSGAACDRSHDDADLAAGRVIEAPTLILWGGAFAAGGGRSPLDVWRQTFAPHATGHGLDCGHFVCEEDPDGVLTALAPFLAAHVGR